MKKIYCLLCVCLLVLAGCSTADTHFLTDAAYRQQVLDDFQSKVELVGRGFYKPADGLTTQEQEALQFLYAYMPIADMTDYDTEYYLKNVRMSLRAKSEMPWGKEVPELLFRHFVLPVRVNNENLDSFRSDCYADLKARVQGMSMQEAILEVNHWCHERVTYRPSDARTTSPLATMSAAYGRCGEESTFTVSALRTIGIPARQVYTPRWAHTDDNHAWVEAWADGKWWFMGACEPEAVLNLGWFNSAASRAMLMHTRVFGKYNGPEEKMLVTDTFTEINLIDNYASTARVDFNIVDAKGNVVPDARVDFMIYNYAEFCPVVTKYADSDGHTFLTAGKGDMLVWASLGGKYGYAKASFGVNEEVTIVLDKQNPVTKSEMEVIDVMPPLEHYSLPEVTDIQHATNETRKTQEDSLRSAYMASFMDEQSATAFVKENGLSVEAVAYLVKSSGNHAVIKQYLRNGGSTEYLSLLSEKDLRDVSLEALEDQMTANSCREMRVEDEMLVPYKRFFQKEIPLDEQQKYREDPAKLVQWCSNHLRMIDGPYATRIAMSSPGVWKSRVADARSRDIFFVNVAWSLGIEARKDRVTGKVQYCRDGQWIDVNFEKAVQTTSPVGVLKLNYDPTPSLDNPEYYSHFTVSRIQDDGTVSLLSFDEGQVDMGGGVSWENVFKKGTALDVGSYILTCGRRMASGLVLATIQRFDIVEAKTTTLSLQLREPQGQDVAVIGAFDSESRYLRDGVETSVLATTGRGYYVIGILGVGQEPTNHALRDIVKLKTDFEAWGRPMVLLFTDEVQQRNFRPDEFGVLPSTTVFGVDKNHGIQGQIINNLHLDQHASLPLFIIADTFNRVVFVSHGYTIGLGEQMMQVIKKLK
ncbi:MAG: transglutaminase-like domain-containing protein [Bacteroidaceae bacterium]|nr:transglutaminase-like domain-containing protein [Bacteroidaceae bacterium]